MYSVADLSARSNSTLDALFHSIDGSQNRSIVSHQVWQAMSYSTLNGGKRIRASLCYASGLALGAEIESIDPVAQALECIHAYSLIHDDLPAMDDDDLRRGKPTCHKAFDEATAILAGDALQTLAFELIASPSNSLSDSQVRSISYRLSQAAGQNGMVGGQMLDMLATQSPNAEQDSLSVDNQLKTLEAIHKNKTGALITASVICGALCAKTVASEYIDALTTYANSIGLAFQVIDDILDIESSTEELGKMSGADQLLGKLTYPSLIGMEQSKLLADNLFQQAIESLSTIGDNTELLFDIAKQIIHRTN
jgi:geranylgeranyl pyrophosphate synthase